MYIYIYVYVYIYICMCIYIYIYYVPHKWFFPENGGGTGLPNNCKHADIPDWNLECLMFSRKISYIIGKKENTSTNKYICIHCKVMLVHADSSGY